jgi:hypothetical protein
MAAEMISIWGRGYISMTDEEFADARSRGYDGPKQSLVLMEISEEARDEVAFAAQVGSISGVAGGPEDESVRVAAKVHGLLKAELQEQCKRFGVRFLRSGQGSQKPELQGLLLRHLNDSAQDRATFLNDSSLESERDFLKGYCRNEHITAQAIGFMKLVNWLTKEGKLPKFRHHVFYDNAPSHHKRAENSLNIDDIAKSDGKGKHRRRDTVWRGAPQSMTVIGPDGTPLNKGCLTIGLERGHWDELGRRTDSATVKPGKALALDEMRDILRKDPDFASCPTILQDTFSSFDGECLFSMSYLAKFWCSLAWIEQYWNDCKQVTREQCDYTITGLKAVFPIALASACPISRIRRYMQRSLDHVTALNELGRNGDFDQIPSLRKQYKRHRKAELIRLGVESEEVRRDRASWGKVQHARLVVKDEDDLGVVLPTVAAACAAAMAGVVEEEAEFDVDDVEIEMAEARANAAAAADEEANLDRAVQMQLDEDASAADAHLTPRVSLRVHGRRPPGFFFALVGAVRARPRRVVCAEGSVTETAAALEPLQNSEGTKTQAITAAPMEEGS